MTSAVMAVGGELASAYAQQSKIVTESGGRRWVAVCDFNGTQSAYEIKLWYSDDDTNWSENTNARIEVGTATSAWYPDLFCDYLGHLHLVYLDNASQDRLQYKWMKNPGTATSWTINSLIKADTHKAPKVIAAEDPNNTDMVVVVAVERNGDLVSELAQLTVANNTLAGGWDTGLAVIDGPGANAWGNFALDFNHNGDGKTRDTGDTDLQIYHCGSSGTATMFRRGVVHSAGDRIIYDLTDTIDGVWYIQTNATEELYWGSGFYDGSRFVYAGYFEDENNPGTGAYKVWDINRTDGTVSATTTPSLGAADVFFGSATFGGSNQDVYLIGVDHTAGSLNARPINGWRIPRSGGTLGTPNQLTTGLTDGDDEQARPSLAKGDTAVTEPPFIYQRYNSGAETTFSVLVLNNPPNAPTVSAPAGETTDATGNVTVSWTHSDPDSDPQAGWAIKRRKVTLNTSGSGAGLVYGTEYWWNESTGDWQGTEVENSGTASSTVTDNTGTGLATNSYDTYEYAVATADAGGLGAYSAWVAINPWEFWNGTQWGTGSETFVIQSADQETTDQNFETGQYLWSVATKDAAAAGPYATPAQFTVTAFERWGSIFI